jgi:TetR/AcrR family transcriptional regulator, transcriptional repressor for nem operon
MTAGHNNISMRNEIKTVTTELLIRHGYRGFRFKEVAEIIGTTRANIHYYFGSKANLCEEVIVDYTTETMHKWTENWRSAKRFSEKIVGMMESNRQRYLQYNPTGKTAHPWSLIGRMRMERDVIGPKAQNALTDFGTNLHEIILHGIHMAVKNKEYDKRIPREDVVLQLVAIANSAGPITQDGGSFDRLEQLYLSFSHIIDDAYGLK